MKAAGIVSMFVLSGLLMSGGSAALAQTSMYKDHTHGESLRDSFAETDDLSRWSSGVEYLKIDRVVELENGLRMDLQTELLPLNVGYDMTRWATFYIATGQNITGLDFSSDFKVAGGLKFNWWHNDISDPKFMYGRLSVRSRVEFGYYESDSGNNDQQSRWSEVYGDLTVNYEKILAQRISDVWIYPYSIAYYGGGVVSVIRGSVDGLNGSRDFDEVQALGTVVGVDLFVSHNLSLGAQLQYFNELSVLGVSLRYHFH